MIKKNAQTKFYETKSLRKYRKVLSVLTNYSWAWGLPCNVVNIPGKTSLKKCKFSFAGRCQWEIMSWLGMVSLHAATVSVSSHMHQYIRTVSGRRCFLVLFTLSCSYDRSASSSTEFPEPWGEGFYGDIIFKTPCSKITICTLSSLVSPCEDPSAAGGGISDDSSARHWSMRMAKCHLRTCYWYVALAGQ